MDGGADWGDPRAREAAAVSQVCQRPLRARVHNIGSAERAGVPRLGGSGGAFMLYAGARHFGAESVHLAVVDPGVGSSRRRLAIRAGGRFYVGPDNGLFAIVIEEVGLQDAVELAPRPQGAPTFEGRDVFAPAAAALAAGIPLSSLRPPPHPPKMLGDAPPRVWWSERCGYLVTNREPPTPRDGSRH